MILQTIHYYCSCNLKFWHNFLLHRLSEEELQSLGNGNGRMINVGMTVDVDAKFIVSIFDENDPDDLKKKERYLELKQRQTKDDCKQEVYAIGNKHSDLKEKSRRLALEEAILILFCILLFGIYILVRLLFHEPGKDGATII